ncbi:hypothetical protein [Salinisphaera sp. LB1]|uniref:RIFT barrel domain-containing protein n=1 Tax=Salinisphaera sp. LB1 TaxID=2183911 RepID=UPI000D7E1848|nr:hypothetical protein [Salinisphaera sp. LB1]AWN14316.1 hypothetical protein SALB1_0109 [Salinisphaera sp. LB1]
MSNRLAIIFSCVIVAAALVGCGGGSGGSGGGTSSQPAGGGNSGNLSNNASPAVSAGSNLSSLPSGTARHITDVSVQNYGSSNSAGTVDVTFGQVFAKGDVGASQHVVAAVNGQVLPTQVDRKATWADGSVRHSVVTVQLPAPASGKATTLQLYAVAHKGGLGVGTVSLDDLLGTNFTANVRITLGGTTYTANARNALEQIAQSGTCPAWGQRSCKRWLSGGLVSEWIVPATLTSGNATAPRLRVFFNVRAYRAADGSIGNVRVDSVIENDQTYAVAPNNETYDAKITVGQNSYSISNLTQYTQTRWHKVLWSQGGHSYFAGVSTAYLQQSKAVSKYANLKPSNQFLDSRPQAAQPMNHLDQTPDMGATGAQAGIGPLPKWTSTYVVSGDQRAFAWMLADDDAAGGYGFHYRDSATGRPVTIVDHPYITIADYSHASQAGGAFAKDLLPACANSCSNPNRFEIAHQPSIGYVSYLETGDFYYLEELQFEASYDELWANPSYRKYAKGRLLEASPQVRGQAWELRTISNAAFATPDHDPMKTYFVDQINYIVSDYIASYVDDPGHPLHTLDAYGAVHYPAHQPSNISIAPWQADFFTWAVGHAAEQGVPGANKLLNWLAPFQIGLMTSAKDGDTNGFCWQVASGYTFQFRDDNNSPIYTSLDEVYAKTYPSINGLGCNSQEMANQLSTPEDQLKPGQMIGFSASPTGFPANLQIALAVAADSSAGNAAKAWAVFDGRVDKPNYSQYPNFAVVPRGS